MATVSGRFVGPVALAALLILAGCSGATGPTGGTEAVPGSTPPATATQTEAPGTTDGPSTSATSTTAGPPAVTEASIPTEELSGPPYEVDEYPLLVWIYGVHYERLRDATFTYERQRRSAQAGAGRWSGTDETIRIGADGREHWTHTLYGVGTNGTVTIEDYRDGEGLQYERGPDRETGEIEYLVFEYEDDLFAETIALGPKDARFALSMVDRGGTNLTYGGIRTVDGERLHVYAASNASENHTVDVTLLVTDRGVIRQAETRWSVERADGTSVVESTEIYRDVNETTVEPPEWIDEARAAADR